jgi:plasmid stabilization system protein ParE
MVSSWLPGIPLRAGFAVNFVQGCGPFPIRSYVLFYRIDGENINVLRLLHGQRDIETLFGA